MTARRVTVLLAAVMAVWPACGESDEQTLPGRASPGAEATAVPAEGDGENGFVAAANAACERADERIDEIEPPGSNEAWLGFGRRVERRFTKLMDALETLDPPRQHEDAFRTWLRRLEGSRRAFRSLYRAFALPSPEVEGLNSRVKRALDRAYANDTKARQWVQLRLTDLYSCYNATAYGYARSAI